MKVLILSTFEKRGGAALAAQRLYHALRKEGYDCKIGFAIQGKDTSRDIQGVRFTKTLFNWIAFWYQFIRERLNVLLHISERKYLYKYSLANGGMNLLHHPEVERADVIHLHWVNFGFLSLKSIQLLSQKKKVIWTVHDFWAMTGGCHLPKSCRLFEVDCHDCFYLKRGLRLSQTLLMEKREFYSKFKGTLVTVSEWMRQNALSSFAIQGKEVLTIGNPLDVEIFFPLPKTEVDHLKRIHKLHSDTFCVLAGAADLKDENKGFKYVIELMTELNERDDRSYLLMVIGNVDQVMDQLENIDHLPFGMVSEEANMRNLYNIADVFVLPSLQESLSYTSMESLACGTPVVAFDSGGVRDLVKHKKTGILAEGGNLDQLTKGVLFLRDNPDLYKELSENGRKHILENYAEKVITEKYKSLYTD